MMEIRSTAQIRKWCVPVARRKTSALPWGTAAATSRRTRASEIIIEYRPAPQIAVSQRSGRPDLALSGLGSSSEIATTRLNCSDAVLPYGPRSCILRIAFLLTLSREKSGGRGLRNLSGGRGEMARASDLPASYQRNSPRKRATLPIPVVARPTRQDATKPQVVGSGAAVPTTFDGNDRARMLRCRPSKETKDQGCLFGR